MATIEELQLEAKQMRNYEEKEDALELKSRILRIAEIDCEPNSGSIKLGGILFSLCSYDDGLKAWSKMESTNVRTKQDFVRALSYPV